MAARAAKKRNRPERGRFRAFRKKEDLVQPLVSALMMSPKKSHFSPLNCIILSCSIGAKSVAPVLTLMPGIRVVRREVFQGCRLLHHVLAGEVVAALLQHLHHGLGRREAATAKSCSFLLFIESIPVFLMGWRLIVVTTPWSAARSVAAGTEKICRVWMLPEELTTRARSTTAVLFGARRPTFPIQSWVANCQNLLREQRLLPPHPLIGILMVAPCPTPAGPVSRSFGHDLSFWPRGGISLRMPASGRKFGAASYRHRGNSR